jgi:hypothetical protein
MPGGHCNASHPCATLPALSFQFPSFAAYICHPQFGNEVAQGQLVVTLSALQFTATEPPFELPLDEAMVGIGRFTSVFRAKNTKFHQQMQATLALPGRTIAYPLTEGFTETFTEGFQSRRFDPLTIP